MTTNIQTRSSVLAVKKEVTEGLPVLPTVGTDAIALQDDISVSPSFDELDNAELKASIGTAKVILGNENPTVSFSHYLRASGVEGQAPNFGALIESFMGARFVSSVQHDVVSGSTVGALKVGAGEGLLYQRGQGVLIKDSVNGFRVRCIDSVATDDLTLGFQLPVAPAAGVNLGRNILYKPANSNHPTLTTWFYLGNKGAIEMVSGARVTSMSVDATAGEFINANYSLEGLAFYFDPITVVSANTFLDFETDAGNATAIIPAKTYKDPHQLAAAIQTAMQGAVVQIITVIYNDSGANEGKFTISASGAVFKLEFTTGTNAANTIAATLGFTSTDKTGALTYSSTNPISFAFPYAATFDNADPNVGKNMEVMLGDDTDFVCFEASAISISGSNTKADLTSLCSESGKSGSIISERSFDVTITARLSQSDADVWRRFREGSNTKFQMTVGPKVGGNWVPGKVSVTYCPTATVSSFTISDADGLAVMEIGLKAYVGNDGAGEFYFSFL